jgi:hypothetical protein
MFALLVYPVSRGVHVHETSNLNHRRLYQTSETNYSGGCFSSKLYKRVLARLESETKEGSFARSIDT